jgi:hypothetical protein
LHECWVRRGSPRASERRVDLLIASALDSHVAAPVFSQ